MAKVLVIDSDMAAIKALSQWLPTVGHAPLSALDAPGGVGEYVKSRPDVVLTEFDIPAGGAAALVNRLRGEMQQTVPVVIMSPRPPEQIGNILKLHRVYYINKPFSGPELYAVINTALGIEPQPAAAVQPAQSPVVQPPDAAPAAAPAVQAGPKPDEAVAPPAAVVPATEETQGNGFVEYDLTQLAAKPAENKAVKKEKQDDSRPPGRATIVFKDGPQKVDMDGIPLNGVTDGLGASAPAQQAEMPPVAAVAPVAETAAAEVVSPPSPVVQPLANTAAENAPAVTAPVPAAAAAPVPEPQLQPAPIQQQALPPTLTFTAPQERPPGRATVVLPKQQEQGAAQSLAPASSAAFDSAAQPAPRHAARSSGTPRYAPGDFPVSQQELRVAATEEKITFRSFWQDDEKPLWAPPKA